MSAQLVAPEPRIITPGFPNIWLPRRASSVGGGFGTRLHQPGRGPGDYTPLGEGNCVLAFEADDAGVSTVSASILDPSAFDKVSWSTTNCTVAPNSDGAMDLLTAVTGGFSSVIIQTPTSLAALGQTAVYTLDVKRVAHDWFYFETRSNAAGRTWFNVNTGAVGASGADHTGASIAALGGGKFRIHLTASGASIFRMALVTGDTLLTADAGQQLLVENATISQTRVASFRNIASGAIWSQATTNAQPQLRTDTWLGGRACLEFFGGQSIVSYEAAVVAAFTNNNPLTVYYLMQTDTPDQGSVIIGAANDASASAANIRQYGINTGGTGQWIYRTADSASVAVSSTTAASTSNTDFNLFTWKHSGNDITLDLNGVPQAVTVNPTNNPASIAPAIVAMGAQLDGTPEKFLLAKTRVRGLYVFSATHDGPTSDRVEAYLATYGGLTL